MKPKEITQTPKITGHESAHLGDHEVARGAAIATSSDVIPIDWRTLEPHPIAGTFPLMAKNELDSLAKDIEFNGLQRPIILYDGQVLDGRNRLKGCEATGVDPQFEVYGGDDPVGYVLSANLHRRHLTESQRAMVAARLCKNSSTSSRQAAEMVKVSHTVVIDAGKVLAGVPELVIAVDQGSIRVDAAKKIAEESKSIQKKTLMRIEEGEKPRAALESVKVRTNPKNITYAVGNARSTEPCISKSDAFEFVAGLDDNSVDLLLLNPPRSEENLAICGLLAEEAKRVLHPEGTLAIMFGKEWLVRLIYEIQPRVEETLPWRWLLDYRTGGKGSHQCQRLQVGSNGEVVLLWGKPRKRIPSDKVHARANELGKLGLSEDGAEKLVSLLSDEHDLVVDPFMGVGTIGVACVRLGRNYAGCDIEEFCVERARTRIYNAKGGPA